MLRRACPPDVWRLPPKNVKVPRACAWGSTCGLGNDTGVGESGLFRMLQFFYFKNNGFGATYRAVAFMRRQVPLAIPRSSLRGASSFIPPLPSAIASLLPVIGLLNAGLQLLVFVP
jgi:hypothetical protein